MPRVALPLQIDAQTRNTLEKFVHSSSTPQSLAMRSRIVLAAADGSNNQQIAAELRIPPITVGKWRRSFALEGIEGLRDAARSGRPPRHDSDTRHRVQTRVCQQPEDQGRWTVRTLAAEVGLPTSTVHAMLVAAKLQPHRIRTFTFSPDPDFEAKLLDIVGLYLNPPENALVLCVDEKTGIQALNRTQPGLPLRASKPRAWTNEYVRHGTQTLLAALEIATGKVVAHVRDRRTTVDFLSFMDEVVKSYPVSELRVVLDNLNIHKNEAAKQWLLCHPRVHFHYTPTHASWMNMVECFFSILTRQALKQSVHRSKKELKEFLIQYLKKYSENPTPFTWTKGPEHLQRIIEATREYQVTHPKNPKQRKAHLDNVKD
ncbi:MAG TPA: IS630 family transposase [Bryobacteraceae bacterium]|nr:IS630 family transposase [Bryobacteraceae bacterium]